MADSWQSVADQMNAMFKPGADIADTAKKFKIKHGHDGKGTDTNTVPYKFGMFAVDVADSQGKRAISIPDEAKWLIDSGTRHFDPTSIGKLEEATRTSLTQPAGSEIPITFTIDPTKLAPGSKATADVVPTIVNGQITAYTVTIHCAP
jgi:hypothetical protein